MFTPSWNSRHFSVLTCKVRPGALSLSLSLMPRPQGVDLRGYSGHAGGQIRKRLCQCSAFHFCSLISTASSMEALFVLEISGWLVTHDGVLMRTLAACSSRGQPATTRLLGITRYAPFHGLSLGPARLSSSITSRGFRADASAKAFWETSRTLRAACCVLRQMTERGVARGLAQDQ